MTHNLMGIALKAQGNLNEALNHYQEALRLNPNYPQAHNNLANALVALKRFPEAVTHYRRALALKPDYAEAQQNLNRIQSFINQQP